MNDLFALLWPPLTFLFISWVSAYIAGYVTRLITAPAQTRESGRVHTGVLPTVPLPSLPPVDKKTEGYLTQGMYESITRLLALEDEPDKHEQGDKLFDFVLAMEWLRTHETCDGLTEAMQGQWRINRES